MGYFEISFKMPDLVNALNHSILMYLSPPPKPIEPSTTNFTNLQAKAAGLLKQAINECASILHRSLKFLSYFLLD